MSDERENLPSASVIERIALCPGSWRQSRGVTEVSTPEMKKWAESGDRIHLWLEAPGFIDLSPWPEELDVAERCAADRDKLIRQAFPDWDELKVEVIAEKRFWMADTNGKKRASGRVDYSALVTGRVPFRAAIIADYKTNRGDVEVSERNLQLRTLAVLLAIALHWKVDRIFVGVVQPLVGKPELCCYEIADLHTSYKQIIGFLDAADDPKAPLIPGAVQCRFCPAKLKCPAVKRVIKSVADQSVPEVAGLSGPELSLLLDQCEVVEQVIKAARAKAKELLTTNPDAIANWFLKPNSGTREVTNPFAVFEALWNAQLMDKDTFLKECVSVGIGDLEKSLKKRNDMKPKAVSEALEQHCSPFITKKPKAASLDRK